MADTRNWIVEPEPYLNDDGEATRDADLAPQEIGGALAELGPMLRRLGGSVLINADREKVGDPDLYVTKRLVVSYTLHLPLTKAKPEVEAIELSEPEVPEEDDPESLVAQEAAR